MSRFIHLFGSLPDPEYNVRHRTQYNPAPATFHEKTGRRTPLSARGSFSDAPSQKRAWLISGLGDAVQTVSVQSPSITLSGSVYRVVRHADAHVVITRGTGRSWRLAGAAVSERVMAGLRVRIVA